MGNHPSSQHKKSKKEPEPTATEEDIGPKALQMYQDLMKMGFPDDLSLAAASKYPNDIEDAMEWLMSKQTINKMLKDQNIDTSIKNQNNNQQSENDNNNNHNEIPINNDNEIPINNENNNQQQYEQQYEQKNEQYIDENQEDNFDNNSINNKANNDNSLALINNNSN
eukprot:428178_1